MHYICIGYVIYKGFVLIYICSSRIQTHRALPTSQKSRGVMYMVHMVYPSKHAADMILTHTMVEELEPLPWKDGYKMVTRDVLLLRLHTYPIVKVKKTSMGATFYNVRHLSKCLMTTLIPKCQCCQLHLLPRLSHLLLRVKLRNMIFSQTVDYS